MCIFLLSAQPSVSDVRHLFPQQDKVAHLIEYGVLTAIVSTGMRRKGTVPYWWLILGPIVFSALYGASDEFHQYFVPKRSCDMYDWLTDTSAAVLTQVLLYGKLWLSSTRNKDKKEDANSLDTEHTAGIAGRSQS